MYLKHFVVRADGTELSEVILPAPAQPAAYLNSAPARLRNTGLTVYTTMRVGEPARASLAWRPNAPPTLVRCSHRPVLLVQRAPARTSAIGAELTPTRGITHE